jgi:uncharacterized protein
MNHFVIPDFEPHPLLRSGHAQTIAASVLPGKKYDYNAIQHYVSVSQGDQVVLHDDRPDDWKWGDQVVLLLHGLAGCHQSNYLIRTSAKLKDRNIRSFRMDFRGCGAGKGLSRNPYHAGRTEDIIDCLHKIQTCCPDSPITLVGFSLSGNMVLNLLSRQKEELPETLNRAMVVNPSIDLSACVKELSRPIQRIYDKHFVKLLMKQAKQDWPVIHENPEYNQIPKPATMNQFDDLFTAPVCGFGTAENYYHSCSSAPHIQDIEIPTLIITAKDDPLVPVNLFEKLELPESVKLHIVNGGGHLGYISTGYNDEDRRWMDWRVIDWVMHELKGTNGVNLSTPVRSNILKAM